MWTMRIKVPPKAANGAIAAIATEEEAGEGGKKAGAGLIALAKGPFATEEEAAREYDALAGPLNRPVNFPTAEWPKKATKEQSSDYRGVCWHKPTRAWTASISVANRNRGLGYFKTAVRETTHRAHTK